MSTDRIAKRSETMDSNIEVIALVLDESDERRRHPAKYCEGAQCLVRSSDGTVSLEAVESQEEFERTARTTGCFRRGKAIHDPETREVIGYEMEEVSVVQAARGM